MSTHPWIRWALVALLVASLPGVAWAQNADEGKKYQLGQNGGGNGQGAQQPEFPAFETIVTGEFQKLEGFYTLYHHENQLFAEIPEHTMGTPFLLATSIAAGPQYMGWQWDDMPLYWERQGKRLVLYRPQVRYRAQTSTLAETVKKTYTDAVVATAPILTMGQTGPIIDMAGLYSWQAAKFVPFIGSMVDASLAKLAKVKPFPNNIEVAVSMPLGSSGFFAGGSGGSQMTTLHYSLSQIPETGYQPREADDRIGYFLTAVKDFDKSARDGTRFVRYVNRWHLEKADPELELSPPKNPITFYIEKSVPVRYRRYVREGILEWNEAFRKCGIVNAIEVRQQTATNEYADRDPEDVRYNFFRWITTDEGFAMGPSRVNPWTGQILDADIIFDDAMVNFYLQDYDLMIAQAKKSHFSPRLRDFLDENPERDPTRFWETRRKVQEGIEIPRDERLQRLSCGREACNFGRFMAHQMAVARATFALAQKEGDGDGTLNKWPEEFVGQVIKEIVMHEVGHTLGLRHNFKASSWRKLAVINGSEVEDLGGSVMDYNAVNVAVPGEPQGNYMMTTIGPYDYWAIEYGYSDKDPKKILARVAEDGLDYATDEDLSSPDPLVNVWDLGDDPLAYAKSRMRLVKKLRENLVDRVVAEGQSYHRARSAFDMLLFDYLNASRLAARYVGGQYVHRDHKGDPNARPPIEIVPAKKQKEALAFLAKNVFSEEPFQFSPELLNHLGKNHWSHWGAPGWSQGSDYPIHDRVLTVQLWVLFDVLNPFTMRRIFDAEAKVPADEDALTLADLMETLTDSIFNEVFSPSKAKKVSNRNPLISNVRRNLQREFVTELIWHALQADVGYAPRTARTLAWYHLRRIKDGIDTLLSKKSRELDTYTRAHLEETRVRIEKAVQASYELK